MVYMSWRHSESRDVVSHHNSFGHVIENRSACRSSHRNFPNIHQSGFYRSIGPPVPMSCHLQIQYRITCVCSNLQHAGWGAIAAHPCRPIMSLKNPFQRKSSETLVSTHSPTLWHTYVLQGSSLRPQGPRVLLFKRMTRTRLGERMIERKQI